MKFARCAPLVFLLAAFAAQADISFTVTRGATAPTPIAVVPFAQPPNVGVDIAQVVAADLDRSGVFKTLPRSDMTLEKPTDLSQVNLRNWRMLSQNDLVIGTVTLDPVVPNKVLVGFRLINVYGSDSPQQNLLLSQDNFTLSDADWQHAKPREAWRHLAHQVANRIYERLTGVRGVFDTRIAYVTSSGLGQSRHYELNYADADGDDKHVIARNKEPLMSPAWSPDGRKLAFVGFERGNSAIYIQTLATGELLKFVGEKGINGAPSWSPDGSRLAVTLSFEHNPDIYIIDLGTKSRRRITTDFGIDTDANWSPDGRTLAFVSDRGGQPQIYTVSADGGPQTRLTFEGKRNEQPRYAPDGKSLVEVQDFHIAIMDLQSHSVRVLTPGPLDEDPSFAPNGKMLMYTTRGPQGEQMATISVDGNVQTSVGDESNVRNPAWSPFSSPN
ncbi:MAG: Tol-Pal system beta propeller repeat protein TolB [Nevskia sp.]|nr:Tol-Pal system beta propeller repeat protein TolB [Nevskia sp.]